MTESGPDPVGHGNSDAGTDAPGHLGLRLRANRLQVGMGLRELARRVGCSPSHISQVERGKAAPSVSTLYAMTAALGISMDALFGAVEGGQPQGPQTPTQVSVSVERVPDTLPPLGEGPVLRRERRRRIQLQGGVQWERLTPTPDPRVDFLEVRYPVGGGSGESPLAAIQHSGNEYAIVLEGRLSIQVGFHQYELREGDSFAFESAIPHRFWNEGREEVRAVWVVVNRSTPGPQISAPSSSTHAPGL